jgi:hypothetical protein
MLARKPFNEVVVSTFSSASSVELQKGLNNA